jgi:hypothetical protein
MEFPPLVGTRRSTVLSLPFSKRFVVKVTQQTQQFKRVGRKCLHSSLEPCKIIYDRKSFIVYAWEALLQS